MVTGDVDAVVIIIGAGVVRDCTVAGVEADAAAVVRVACVVCDCIVAGIVKKVAILVVRLSFRTSQMS